VVTSLALASCFFESLFDTNNHNNTLTTTTLFQADDDIVYFDNSAILHKLLNSNKLEERHHDIADSSEAAIGNVIHPNQTANTTTSPTASGPVAVVPFLDGRVVGMLWVNGGFLSIGDVSVHS
jgi:hypothetical protein